MPDYENGKIPPSLLRRVSNFVPLYSGVNSNVGSDLLREDAWAALNMLQVAFLKGFERPLNVSEAYRGLTRQTAVWQQYINGDGPMAARPGTSNHGWALACDFASGVNTYGSATKYWMDRNAPRWGWHPVGNSFAKPEAWHFEFKPGTATETIPASGGATPFPTTPTTPETEEEDMSAQDVANILARLDVISSALSTEDSGTGQKGIRGTVNNLWSKSEKPDPRAVHHLVRLEGRSDVFHSVDFSVLRSISSEAARDGLVWQLQQIGALDNRAPALQVEVVKSIEDLRVFGTLVGPRPAGTYYASL